MVFSSIIFIFYFLPLVLVAVAVSPKAAKNLVLLTASLLFYAWGEGWGVLIMVSSILVNYVIGVWLTYNNKKLILAFGVSINLALLAYYKYGNFLVENIGSLVNSISTEPIGFQSSIALPIGISFFTFQSISYLVDVYRGDAQTQKNPINLGLYIALFPQLIAGPIVRYTTVMSEIESRRVDISLFSSGAQRFMIGLGKKVLIANTAASIADPIFNLPPEESTMAIAWLGIIAYSLQIFFDFSGYSDMAIGLGRMFGFKFLENFNLPYIAHSVQEFWRRWHISLSTWFRDYLYIPLGGNRLGEKRTYLNLIIVFFLTGFWHGASWNFIVWGLFHGLFLILERKGWNTILNSCPRFIGHIYTLFVVAIGWVFFRAETLGEATSYIGQLFSFKGEAANTANIWVHLDSFNILLLSAGIIFSTNLPALVGNFIMKNELSTSSRSTPVITQIGKFIGLILLLMITVASISQLASGTYNPFIYYRF